MKLFIKKTVLLCLSLVVMFVGFSPLAVHAAGRDAICNGIGAASGQDGCEADDEGSEKIDSTISTAIDILALVAAVIAVIMIIVGGLRYVTSSGDSTSTANARNTIIYAVVGLVIIALARVIVVFAVNKVTN